MKWQEEERRRYGDRPVDAPAPGFFEIRLVKGGPFVPAAICYGPTPDPLSGDALDRSYYWRAIVDGLEVEVEKLPGDRVLWIWQQARRIDEKEYGYRVRMGAWARQHRRDLPEANPTRPIDLNAMPPLFQPKVTGEKTNDD